MRIRTNRKKMREIESGSCKIIPSSALLSGVSENGLLFPGRDQNPQLVASSPFLKPAR